MKKIELVFMVVAWAIYFVLCNWLIDIFGSPYFVGLLLRIGTTFVLLVFILISKKWINPFKNVKTVMVLFAVAFSSFLFDCMINIGLKYTSVASGSALLRLEIVFVLLINTLVNKTKNTIKEYALIFVTMCGAFLIMLEDFNNFSFDVWSLLFVGSAIINTLTAFGIKYITQHEKVNSYSIAIFNNTIALILYALITFLTGYKFAIVIDASLQLLGCVLSQVILLLIYYKSLETMPVWIVKLSLLFIPVIILIIQVSFCSEVITLTQYFGIFLTLIGGLFIIIMSKKNNKEVLGKDKILEGGGEK